MTEHHRTGLNERTLLHANMQKTCSPETTPYMYCMAQIDLMTNYIDAGLIEHKYMARCEKTIDYFTRRLRKVMP